MTDELTVNQLDPAPDLSPNSRSSAPRTAGWLRDGCDGSLMRDHYGLAQRTSDDDTLMYAPIHGGIPKLSLWRPQAEAPEQELGQALPSELLGRLRGGCPSSCSSSSG